MDPQAIQLIILAIHLHVVVAILAVMYLSAMLPKG